MSLSDGFPSLHTGLLSQLRTSVVTTESWPLTVKGHVLLLAGLGHFPNESAFTLKMPALRREETGGLVDPSVLRQLKLEQVPVLYSPGALEASSQALGRGTFLHWGKDQTQKAAAWPPQRVNIPNRLLLDFCMSPR